MGEVYSYLIQNHMSDNNVKSYAHKRSELKRVYSNIVNLSKRSPVYKIDLSKENKEYTIGIKENALDLKARLREIIQTDNEYFNSKAVAVSDRDTLAAQLLQENTDGIPDEIQLEVKNLANHQINKGKDLFHGSRGLEYGAYEFSVSVMDRTYQLTYLQKERTDNLVSMRNVTDFLNNCVPGITATVEEGLQSEYSHIKIESDATGKIGKRNFNFRDTDGFHIGIVEFFGMNRMEKAPENASFLMNGYEKEITTNLFLVENKLQISLLDTKDEPVFVRIVPDSNKILDYVEKFTHTFNGLIHIAKKRTQETTEHLRAVKLINELKNLEKLYKNELENCGITLQGDGKLSIDYVLAVQAAEDGSMKEFFSKESGFVKRLMDKTETIVINPMDYLDKTVVTYPNNDRSTFANPYVTSMYSGLFFSSYC